MNWYKIAQMSALMSMSYEDIFRALRKLGFAIVRQSGSHTIWKNPINGQSLSVPYHKGRQPNYYVLNLGIHKNLGMNAREFASYA